MSKISSLAFGVRWGTVSVVTVTAFQLIFMAVMARLLDPADFGLVAIAHIALRFFSYFSQMGIGPAIIQKPSLSDGDIRSALALSIGVSGFFFVLAVVSANYLEEFFDMDSLAAVIRVLAINFIVVGFSSVSSGLIRRHRRFRALAKIEIVSYVIGYGMVGITAAYLGAGVWSLVAAFVTQSLLTASLGYMVVRHPIGLAHTREQRKHFIGFGGRYSVIGFIEFLTSNIDSLIIGKIMGAVSAGYYNRSLLLANLPVQNPTKVLTQALFPILSTMGSQHEKQSISVQLSALIVGSYSFATGVGVSIAAPEIVLALLGNKWQASIPILQVLALSVGPIYLSNVIGVTLDSMAELTKKLRVQFFVFVLLAGALWWVAPSGNIVDVAKVIVAAFTVRLCMMSWVVIRLLRVPAENVFRIILSIMTVTASAGMLIGIVSSAMPPEYHVVIRLIASIVAGIVGFGVGLMLARFIAAKLPAVIYLTDRVPLLSRFMRL